MTKKPALKLRRRPTRSARLNMRLFPEEKQSIEETASGLDMSPPDYLVALHREALKGNLSIKRKT